MVFRWLRNFPRIVWKTNHFHLSISHDNNSSTKKLTTISFLFDMFKLDVIEIHYSSSPKTPIMIYQRHYLIRNNFQTSMTCVGSSLLLTFTLSALREDKTDTKKAFINRFTIECLLGFLIFVHSFILALR